MSVENIARQMFNQVSTLIPDPGDTGTIRVTDVTGPFRQVSIVTAAAETRTLAVPPKVGQRVTLVLKTDGGTCTVTVTGGYNQDADTTMAFSDVGDFATFEAIDDNGTLRWQVVMAVLGSAITFLQGASLDLDTILIGGVTVTSTAAEINRSTDASARVVTTTASAVSLTVTEHAERILLVNTNSTFANTFTLPTAAGTGEIFTVINNVQQTQGSIVVAANGTDIMKGVAYGFGTTEEAAEAFLTSATSDKVTLNLTTTGGLGGDRIVCIDTAANTWSVEVHYAGSAAIATPFSET